MTVTAPRGFVAGGVAAGIKASGNPDLALVATADGQPATAAAVFTQNRMAASPVVVSKAHLAATGGRATAVILNSGNANAANGGPGDEHARRMAAATAAALGCPTEQVLVCSTGLIGIPLPIEVVEAGIPAVVAARHADGGPDAATAMMTTDTFAKHVTVEMGGFTVGGIAKGAAMLAPNMATMLAVLTTDAAATPEQLQQALTAGVADSFNSLVVDGCTSTNDTVILLASGVAGPVPQSSLDDAVATACDSLARQMCHDAEGATKSVRFTVVGARSDEEARTGARKVATSLLVKCSWYGQDPYWGRIASDLGSCGIDLEPTSLSVSYGGVTVAAGGVTIPHDEAAVRAHMAQRELTVVADLGLGPGRSTVLTNDLTHAYIDENMGTS